MTTEELINIRPQVMNWLYKNQIEALKPETCSLKVFHLASSSIPTEVVMSTCDLDTKSEMFKPK